MVMFLRFRAEAGGVSVVDADESDMDSSGMGVIWRRAIICIVCGDVNDVTDSLCLIFALYSWMNCFSSVVRSNQSLCSIDKRPLSCGMISNLVRRIWVRDCLRRVRLGLRVGDESPSESRSLRVCLVPVRRRIWFLRSLVSFLLLRSEEHTS